MAAALHRYPWLTCLLKLNQLLDTMTRDRQGAYREANAYVISEVAGAIVELLAAPRDD